MPEYRVVLNQLGAAIELHNHGGEPVTLLLLNPSRIEYYGRKFGTSTIGETAMLAAKSLVGRPYLVSGTWAYDASTEQYSRM